MENKTKSSPSLVEKIIGAENINHSSVIDVAKAGLPFRAIITLEKALKVSRREISQALQIELSSMNRRESSGKLRAEESDRVLRLANIFDQATELMEGNGDSAAQWMVTPREILDGEKPLMHSKTETGAKEVEDLINRIRYGVFS
ncbi:antitoxin Xre/MbcA/ParS toxin-binding domain-containing protein [Alcanivorax sp.]|jgi:putative toxin-antitoxin system antitoxin component (TIGR02293 family)|uniref:type II RES/Xre toxin-antitoxin system antitoxin n=1 Tax=Alcanivorax sp. TaxID=1872427 RepID=UPI0032D92C22